MTIHNVCLFIKVILWEEREILLISKKKERKRNHQSVWCQIYYSFLRDTCHVSFNPCKYSCFECQVSETSWGDVYFDLNQIHTFHMYPTDVSAEMFQLTCIWFNNMHPCTLKEAALIIFTFVLWHHDSPAAGLWVPFATDYVSFRLYVSA